MLALLPFKRSLALLALTGLLSFPILSGCASSANQQVDAWYPEQSYETFQKELTDKEVTIYLGDGSVRKGMALLIDAKRTSWQEPGASERSQVATSEVWKLEAKGSAKTGQGAGIGLLAGAVTGAALGYSLHSDDGLFDAGDSALMGATLLGLVGALVGAIIGGTSHATAVYEIHPELAPPTSPESDQRSADMDEMFEDF